MSVNEISDEGLLRHAVTGATGEGLRPRWSYVMAIFGLGSTYAKELCRRFGADPDECTGRGWPEDEQEGADRELG